MKETYRCASVIRVKPWQLERNQEKISKILQRRLNKQIYQTFTVDYCFNFHFDIFEYDGDNIVKDLVTVRLECEVMPKNL